MHESIYPRGKTTTLPFARPTQHFYNRKTASSSLILVPVRPLTLRQFAPSPLVLSHYSSSTNPNSPPKSMVSQISMIGCEYKVRTITGDEFYVIYTRSSATLKGCLACFRRMFKNSKDEWVVRTAGLWLARWINGFMHNTMGAQLDVMSTRRPIKWLHHYKNIHFRDDTCLSQ